MRSGRAGTRYELLREGDNLIEEEYNTLEFDVRNGVAHVTLNRPEAGNALNLELAQELLRAVMRCDEEPGVRAVVLAGAGRMFCVGGDLRSFTEQGELLSHHLKEVTTYLHAAISRMARMDPPVVAAVPGAPAGGGVCPTFARGFLFAAETGPLPLG